MNDEYEWKLYRSGITSKTRNWKPSSGKITYVEPYQKKKKDGSSCLVDGSKTKSIIAVVIVVFCTWGFYYSAEILTSEYFQHEMTSYIQIQVKSMIKMTALSICIYYPSLINHSSPAYKKVKKDGSLDITDTEGQLTLEDIFEMTPKAEDALTKCWYRIPKEYDVFEETTKCKEFFEVSKYFAVQYLCYRFTPKVTAGKEYKFLRILNSLTDPGMFYRIAMNGKAFENVTFIQPATFDWGGYPKSRFTTTVKNTEHKGNQTLSHFMLSYYKLKNLLLPAPYETNCINYRNDTPFVEKSECIDKCMTNLITKHLGKVPFASITDKPIPLKIISSDNFKNSTFERMYRRFEKQCERKVCPQNDCVELMYVTTFIRREFTSDGLVFQIDTPLSPNLITEFKPKIEFFEYMIDIFNVASDWFGISFLDLLKLAVIFEKIRGYFKQ